MTKSPSYMFFLFYCAWNVFLQGDLLPYTVLHIPKSPYNTRSIFRFVKLTFGEGWGESTNSFMYINFHLSNRKMATWKENKDGEEGRKKFWPQSHKFIWLFDGMSFALLSTAFSALLFSPNHFFIFFFLYSMSKTVLFSEYLFFFGQTRFAAVIYILVHHIIFRPIISFLAFGSVETNLFGVPSCVHLQSIGCKI